MKFDDFFFVLIIIILLLLFFFFVVMCVSIFLFIVEVYILEPVSTTKASICVWECLS